MATAGPAEEPPLIVALLAPFVLMSLAAFHFTCTVFEEVVLRRNVPILFHVHALQEKGFARMWRKHESMLALDPPEDIVSLLRSARGRVLDVGPGTGQEIRLFNRASIKVVYGVEPSADMHPLLRHRADKHGLHANYHILPCGAEPESLLPALASAGLIKSEVDISPVFDDIICIRVLCGVPRQRETVASLYKLLNPGGRIMVFEHVVNPWWERTGSVVARVLQSFYMAIGWRFWMAGCELTRDTVDALVAAADEDGGWEKVDLSYMGEKFVIPCVMGCLVKRK